MNSFGFEFLASLHNFIAPIALIKVHKLLTMMTRFADQQKLMRCRSSEIERHQKRKM